MKKKKRKKTGIAILISTTKKKVFKTKTTIRDNKGNYIIIK